MQKSTSPKVTITIEKDRIIWDNLVDLAEKHGWDSQAAVAKAMGVKPQQIGQWKTGVRGIGQISVKRICDKAKVTEQWLLTDHSKDDGQKGKVENPMDEIKKLELEVANWKNQYEKLNATFEQYLQAPAVNPPARGKPKLKRKK